MWGGIGVLERLQTCGVVGWEVGCGMCYAQAGVPAWMGALTLPGGGLAAATGLSVVLLGGSRQHAN